MPYEGWSFLPSVRPRLDKYQKASPVEAGRDQRSALRDALLRQRTAVEKPVQPGNDSLVRVSADVVFHRDPLRPTIAAQTTGGGAQAVDSRSNSRRLILTTSDDSAICTLAAHQQKRAAEGHVHAAAWMNIPDGV